MRRKDYEEFNKEDLPEEEEELDEEDVAVEDEDGWEDEVETDEDVADIFNEAQNLDYGRSDLTRKLRSYTDKSPILSGGDIDADWANADVGEESVGGQNPTPDQSDVDEIGEAMGIVYEDDEPLGTDDKLEKRDRNPWELNPASRPESAARAERELAEPLHSTVSSVQRRRTSPSTSGEKSARAAAGKTSTPAERRIRNATATRRGNKSRRVPAEAGHAGSNTPADTSARSTQTIRRGAAGARRESKNARTGRGRSTAGHRGGKRG